MDTLPSPASEGPHAPVFTPVTETSRGTSPDSSAESRGRAGKDVVEPAVNSQTPPPAAPEAEASSSSGRGAGTGRPRSKTPAGGPPPAATAAPVCSPSISPAHATAQPAPTSASNNGGWFKMLARLKKQNLQPSPQPAKGAAKAQSKPSETSLPVEPAAVEVQAESVVGSEATPLSDLSPKLDLDPQSKPSTELEAQAQAQAQAQTENAVPELEGRQQSGADATPASEPQLESIPEIEPGSEPATEAEPTTESVDKSESTPEPAPEPTPESKPESKPESAPASDPQESEPQLDIVAEPESEAVPELDAEPEMAPGMLSTAKNLYEGPSEHNGWISWVESHTGDATGDDDGGARNTAKHAIVLRHKSTEAGHVLHSIKVQSPILRVALTPIFDGYPGVTATLEELVFEAPLRSLFYRMKDLKSLLEAAEANAAEYKDEGEAKKAEHLGLLHDILCEEMRHTIAAHQDLTSEGVITFEHLWTLFAPASMVHTSSRHSLAHDEQVLVVRDEVHVDDGGKLCVPCAYIDSDGDSLGWAITQLSIGPFSGTKKIVELPVVPLDFHGQRADIEKKMMARGRKWAALAGTGLHAYEGRARCPDQHQTDSAFAPNTVVTGRIMVDPTAYWDAVWWEPRIHVEPLDEKLPEGEKRDLTDEESILCSCALRGYSLAVKEWAVFNVDLVQEIEWAQDAFDRLVLPETTKEMVLTLIGTHLGGSVKLHDFVAGKGEGITFLLGGPPGVGKTLTAESVAEHFKTPLISLGAGDLGEEPRTAEQKLFDVFRLAVRWKAVLLLDEADVFLAKRVLYGLKGNPLVSVFTRMLEYYPGILFLTTNRVDAIDAAVMSRIDVTLNYPDLSRPVRDTIWSGCLELCSIPVDVDEKDRLELAKFDMNGRQIRNVIKTAVLMAASKDEKLQPEHLKAAAQIVCPAAVSKREAIVREAKQAEERRNAAAKARMEREAREAAEREQKEAEKAEKAEKEQAAEEEGSVKAGSKEKETATTEGSERSMPPLERPSTATTNRPSTSAGLLGNLAHSLMMARRRDPETGSMRNKQSISSGDGVAPQEPRPRKSEDSGFSSFNLKQADAKRRATWKKRWSRAKVVA